MVLNMVLNVVLNLVLNSISYLAHVQGKPAGKFIKNHILIFFRGESRWMQNIAVTSCAIEPSAMASKIKLAFTVIKL